MDAFLDAAIHLKPTLALEVLSLLKFSSNWLCRKEGEEQWLANTCALAIGTDASFPAD